jgi:hypothetical protein
VTLTAYLPRLGLFDRSVRKPKHRAVDEVERLQNKLAGAELLMAGYRIQIEDLHHEHAAVIRRIDERHGEIVRGLERQLAELARRLELRSMTETVVTRTQELSLDEIRRHCTTPVLPLHESPLANPNAPTHVPSWAVKDEAAT